MKRIRGLGLVLLTATIAIGSATAQAQQVRDVIFASGPQGGGWYASAAAVSQILTENFSGLRVTVNEGGAVSNVRTLNAGMDANVGYSWTSFLSDGINGRGDFEGSPQETVSPIMTMQRNYISIAVPARSDIHSLEDLSDKRILSGNRGGGAERAFEKLMGLIDVTYDDIRDAGGSLVFTGYGDGPSLMRDGHIDAVVIPGPAPHALILEVESQIPVRLLEVDRTILEQFVEQNEGFGIDAVPAGTYRGQDDDVTVLASYTVLAVHDGLPDEFVYDMTKALFENRQKVADVVADFDFLTEETVFHGINRDNVHPGAMRYFEELGL
ncbi:TRAP transporter TAXI family solute receptor [Natronocella acetinitrilica]|uniref:TRAP transporter TAXI family solute receptor n=1 Tax=Natronocella acetinitrilica TaxID=414046 RepID=A0AAE3KHC5_9GAMM|nr:TAXI family TRAP transporter solute-binding subunit [Natronocella acetinitrilica]MCP1676207.1 TRAP transporter TAXI family solute receptor [Natronocella acetinitrilica]